MELDKRIRAIVDILTVINMANYIGNGKVFFARRDNNDSKIKF